MVPRVKTYPAFATRPAGEITTPPFDLADGTKETSPLNLGSEEREVFCRGRLASFKIPRYTVVLDEFPMTYSGKVQKFLLWVMAVAEMGLPKAASMETA